MQLCKGETYFKIKINSLYIRMGLFWWWLLPFANGFNYIFYISPLYNFQVRVEAIDKGDRNRRNRVTVSVIIKYKDTNQHPPAFIPVEQGGMWTDFIPLLFTLFFFYLSFIELHDNVVTSIYFMFCSSWSATFFIFKIMRCVKILE